MVDSSTSAPLFKFDVLKLAKSLLGEIERHRAYIPFSDEEKSGGGSKLPNESRVNTFFRLIGFPSIVSIKAENKKVGVIGGKETDAATLTPGFKIGFGVQLATIKNTDKDNLKVESASEKQSEQTILDALDEREALLIELDYESGTETSNADRVAAFKKPLPPRMDFDGAYQGREFVFKRLSPFLTAYKDVFPGNRELARPFLFDAKQGFLVNDELKRPFLETVVRIRLVNAAGLSKTNTKNYIAQLKTRLEQGLEAANDNDKELKNMKVSLLPEQGDLVEAFIVEQLLSAIPQLARRWISLVKKVDETLQGIDVAFVPTTPGSRQSPLGKQSNQAPVLEAKNSQYDTQIKQLEARIRTSEALIGLLPLQDSVARTTDGTTQPSARNVMSNALTSTFISVLRQDVDQDKKELEGLKKRRLERSQKADQHRVELEMMTGEFSGLSLPDVVFTMTALFLIERSDLLSLFDADTLDEMRLDKVFKQALDSEGVSSSTPSATLDAVKKVREKVKDLYALFNLEVQAAKKKDKRVSAPSRNKGGQRGQVKSKKQERTVDVGADT